MRSLVCQYLLLFALLSGIHIQAVAQENELSKIDLSIWQNIEEKLDLTGFQTSYDFIPGVVKRFAENNDDLLYRHYYALMINLERKFNLPAAIYVGNELAQTARKTGDHANEGNAYQHLSRYYDALGDYHMAAIHIDKALAIYSKINDNEKILLTSFKKLEGSLRYRNAADILPQMNVLLTEAIAKGYSILVNKMHLSLIDPTLEAGQLAEAERHIQAVEKIPLSSPYKPADFPLVIISTAGRAKLAMARNEIDEAEKYYKKVLLICQKEPSKWMEIKVLLELSELEWERDNKAQANTYLNAAQVKAEYLDLLDLLIETFDIKAKFAEKEKRYKETLEFLKKKAEFEKQFNARSDGFNIETYYLLTEKNAMAIEKKNKELELKLKETQLNNSIFILLLFVLLATGSTIGLIKQRNGKMALSKQNKLIELQSEKLQNLDAAKSLFFANISHEIRTPLTLILGPINMLLKENQLTERQVKLLISASQNSKQLKTMINDILDLRKLEMGKMTVKNEPTLVNSFFQTHIDQFESLAQRNQVQLFTDIKIGKNLIAEIDREKCRQVIYNLLSNAFKFTTAGGNVLVSMHITRDILNLTVSDTGMGIHPDDMPFIFDRFYQTTQKDKPVSGGSGIGLSLCFDIAHLFGGTIYAESETGKGTSFHFTFPVTYSEGQITEEMIVKKTFVERISGWAQSFTGDTPIIKVLKTGDATKPCILVVEDNPGLQEYIKMILGEQYHVMTACNGDKALQIISNPINPIIPNLIISDLMMPVMDGNQLLEKLKANDSTRHIPVIMLTARADVANKLQALRIGVDDYMVKPIDEEELLVRIENLLKNFSIRKAESILQIEKPYEIAIISNSDKEWLETFEAYILKNIASEFLTITSLSSEFAMSESTLLRQLKRLTGLSSNQYLNEIRLNEARQMLENRTYTSIAQVASNVGFADPRSFSRSFKSRFGKSPTDIV